MKYTEYYKCSECGHTWSHEWDTEDFNNDFTCCSICNHKDMDNGFDFEEISADEYFMTTATQIHNKHISY